MWSRFMFELVLWPQWVTLARWTQPSGPLCLWQCFIHKYQWNLWEKRKKDWNLYEEVDEIGDIGKFWVFVPLLFRWKSTNGLHMFPEWFCTESECSYWGHIQCHCRRTRQLIKIEKAINQFLLQIIGFGIKSRNKSSHPLCAFRAICAIFKSICGYLRSNTIGDLEP